MKDQMYNFNIEPVRHNQMEMLEMPNTVTEMKNAQQQKQDKKQIKTNDDTVTGIMDKSYVGSEGR